MKCFAATYTDIIKFDRKPNEDFYLISSKYPIFLIADGVTQTHFQAGGYAFPAGAQAAAEIFCYTVLEYLEDRLTKKEPQGADCKKLIGQAFNLANKRIKELNQNEGITEKLDYLVYDYFDTVGIAGLIVKDILHYGYVGDCGLAIFDQNDNLKFQTKDQVLPVLERASKVYKNWKGFPKEKRAVIMRREFRNNPSGEGYGSFTGEQGVKKYYLIDSLALRPKELVVFYSDGFSNYFQFPEFIKILRKQDKKALDSFTLKKAKENYQKFGTDRTLISIIL